MAAKPLIYLVFIFSKMSSLKITNKTLLIRKQQKSSPDQGKVLRDQLHKEIEINLKICGNTTYECSLACIDGFNHCIKHILLDSNAPYKQCEYVYTTNSKQCGKAAPIYGKTCIGYKIFATSYYM